MAIPTPERHATRVTEISVSARAWITGEELASATGISAATLYRIVRLGLIEPAAGAPSEFSAALVPRLRRVLRLHRDLGVDLSVATVLAELVEKVQQLEAELERLRLTR